MRSVDLDESKECLVPDENIISIGVGFSFKTLRRLPRARGTFPWEDIPAVGKIQFYCVLFRRTSSLSQSVTLETSIWKYIYVPMNISARRSSVRLLFKEPTILRGKNKMAARVKYKSLLAERSVPSRVFAANRYICNRNLFCAFCRYAVLLKHYTSLAFVPPKHWRPMYHTQGVPVLMVEPGREWFCMEKYVGNIEYIFFIATATTMDVPQQHRLLHKWHADVETRGRLSPGILAGSRAILEGWWSMWEASILKQGDARSIFEPTLPVRTLDC